MIISVEINIFLSEIPRGNVRKASIVDKLVKSKESEAKIAMVKVNILFYHKLVKSKESEAKIAMVKVNILFYHKLVKSKE